MMRCLATALALCLTLSACCILRPTTEPATVYVAVERACEPWPEPPVLEGRIVGDGWLLSREETAALAAWVEAVERWMRRECGADDDP